MSRAYGSLVPFNKVGFGYVWLGFTTFCQLARGSGSIMGSLFKFLLARGTDSYMCSLFSKCTSRVVLVPSWDRCLAGDAEDPAGKIHWARIRPSAKSLLADAEGKAGKRQWVPPSSKSC